MMNHCKRIFCLLFAALLLLLPSCQTRPIDTPETTEADPADTRTQEEILEEVFSQTDGPVVVKLMSASPILYKEREYPSLINQPHVLDVIFVSIVHWLDISDDGSLCMIGQYAPDLDPAAIAEGRWYETDTECCINRAEYERLLADPESGFTGIGSKVTYTEPDFHLPTTGGRLIYIEKADPKELETMIKSGFLTYVVPAHKTFTVVGIVGEEGTYSDPAYGVHHVYALTDTVGEMLVNYKYDHSNEYDSRLDKAIYQPSIAAGAIRGMAVYRPDPENPDTPQIRCADDKIYSEAEWDAMFDGIICNAGYTVEVTLDSGKSYAAYVANYRSNRYNARTAESHEELRLQGIETAYQYYEEQIAKGTNEKTMRIYLEDILASNEQDPTITRLAELGELSDWRICGKLGMKVRPVRVEE